jgi:(S)-2-hydroxyglutarate dehydrogenase
MAETVDVAVIGGGIIGCATALALSQSGRRVTVLEAEDRLAAHQSGHNSGVLHSGLYYRPGTLRARTCREGLAAMVRFCEEEGIPHRVSGKVVVATTQAELPALARLEERGRANGLVGLERIDGGALREHEPAVRGIAGLWVPETGVVDYAVVTRALAKRAEGFGVTVTTGARMTAVRQDDGAQVVETTGGAVRARLVVTCGGLEADRLARRCGVDPRVAIVPFRGEYYELKPERRGLVKSAIYPVPNPALPFLGVHFTRRVNDQVDAGPNAVLAWSRTGYSRWDVRLGDLAAAVGYVGFWRMALRQWQAGVMELARSYSKTLFARALARLVPEVTADDLVPAGSGVRAQAVDRQGRLLDDFHIVEGTGSLHVINAPSPAATASLAIGKEVARRVATRLA